MRTYPSLFEKWLGNEILPRWWLKALKLFNGMLKDSNWFQWSAGEASDASKIRRLWLSTWCVEAHVGPIFVLPVHIQAPKACHHDSTNAQGDGHWENDDGSSPVLGNGMMHHGQSNQGCHEADRREDDCKVYGDASQEPKLYNG